MSQIDWSTELRKIEREFDGLPPEPSPAELRALREAERREQARRQARRDVLGLAGRLSLVVALATAIYFWPYPTACGLALVAYLGAVGMVLVAGLWTTVCSWRLRMASPHGLSLLIVLWGLTLGAAQVLPRVGYAKVDPGHPAAWRCR